MATSVAPATTRPVDEASPKAAQKSQLTRTRIKYAWLFMAPMLVTLAAVAGWPLAQTVYLSFTDAFLNEPGVNNFIGFENYGFLLTDPDWWNSVRNTLVFTFFSVSIETILGLIIALSLNAAFAGRGLLRAAVLIPWAIPTVISAKMWEWMVNDQVGIINAILLNLGLVDQNVAFVANDATALATMIAVDVWKTTPFMALLILAGLQMLPQECYENARVDGIHPVKVFFRITLPLLYPALMVAIIFRCLDALRVFDIIYVMTGANPNTMSMSIYAQQQLIDFGETGYGSAAATCIFMVIALFTVAYLTLGRVARDD